MLLVLAVILIIANAVAFHVFVWWPTKAELSPAEAHLRDGTSPFRMWHYDLLATVIFAGLAIMSGYGWYLLLKYLGEWHASPVGAVEYCVAPDPMAWVVVALFLSMFTAMIPIPLIMRLMLQSRYEEYVFASFKRSQRGKLLLLPWLNAFVMVAASAFFIATADLYIHFRADDLIINRFAGLGEQTYRYGQIVEFATVQRAAAPNGQIHPRPHLALRFDDGTFWRSIDGNRTADRSRDKAIGDIIDAKTGLLPVDYDVLPW